ncbi:MAG TPA: hypothetical protein VLX29_05705, partial [Nitrospirota bacterium]|nr:hypothetical protein [Nitrospirota bacterium]
PDDHFLNQPNAIPGVVTVEDYYNTYNYVVLLPNGWTKGPQWGYGPAEQALITSYNLLKQLYHIDTNKVFMHGNSLGGAGTLNFAIRYPSMFKALAPSSPAPGKPNASNLTGGVLDLPTIMTCNSADVTVDYAGTDSSNCANWYSSNIKNTMHNVTFMTVENGNHSYGYASGYQAIFEFFDRQLKHVTSKDVQTVHFTPGSTMATVTTSSGATHVVKLRVAPVLQNGTLMVALADLAEIYGRADFKFYDMVVYNNAPSDLVTYKTIEYNKVTANIMLNSTFLRIGGAIHAGDTTGGTTVVPVNDPSIDPRTLPVATFEIGEHTYVPVVYFMNLFGKSVI